jgi:hypothetical protein
MKARPPITCMAPVTMAALPGMRLSSGTIAIGFVGVEAAGTETTEGLAGACAKPAKAEDKTNTQTTAR